jgi:hypothetical protein
VTKQRAPDECWIWLIWGLKKGQCDLLAIASTEEARDRYMEFGKRHGYSHVQHEEVMTNHLYGDRMLGRAFSRTNSR